MQQYITIANQEYLLHDLLDNLDVRKVFGDYDRLAIQFLTDWKNNCQNFFIKTSGSTGLPKVLSLSRERIELSAKKTIGFFSLSKEDSALVCLDHQYIGGMMMLVRSMVAGMDIILVSPDADPLSKISDEKRPGFMAVVPLQLQSLLDQSDSPKLGDIKAIIVGGGELNADLKERCKNSKLPLYHTFGMTETVSHIALCKLNPQENDHFEILPNVEIKCDNQGRLMIKSDVTDEQWIATNDVVEILDETRFKWLGRYDNVINSGGIKIHPELLEPKIGSLFHRSGFHGRLFLAGVPDSQFGNRAILMYEGEIGKNKKTKLIQMIKQSLPKYYGPKEIWCIGEFLETATGKIKRKETLEIYLKR